MLCELSQPEDAAQSGGCVSEELMPLNSNDKSCLLLGGHMAFGPPRVRREMDSYASRVLTGLAFQVDVRRCRAAGNLSQ